MKHLVILSTVAILLFLSFHTVAYPANSHPQTIFGVRPTVEQFKAEILRADLVIRARVTEILFHRGGNHADEDVRIQVLKVYKGKLTSTCLCIRIEIYWHWAWDETGTPNLPRVGDEVILPIEVIPVRAGSSPPDGQDLYYIVPFYYSVEKDGQVSSIFDFPPEMGTHTATVEQFEILISKALKKSRPSRRRYELGTVLFTDDFDDGSLAGWTFLEGTKIRQPHKTGAFIWRDAVGYLWVGPETIQDPELEFHVARDSKTGLFHGERHSTPIEFGIVNGRLRLRSHHYLHHITALTGDPEWTNYQIDVDMWKFRESPHPNGPTDYRKFGAYGRVFIPNFPFTQGEHSFIAVEIGNYANYDVSERTWGDSAFQIRCKYPEPVYLERDPSRILRYTQILDYIGFPVPEATKMHLTARFTGHYVEGWIDGKKILDGEIPDDHPGVETGRIALWTFETFAEFDNLKITQLVEVD
ncbi:hypothetical protein CMK10_16160 [Candidatus Poribacteria bacterium]|jgi:hypothetical protein|nr:hypothetical protein [Candidatus Poribacteria bacterium]